MKSGKPAEALTYLQVTAESRDAPVREQAQRLLSEYYKPQPSVSARCQSLVGYEIGGPIPAVLIFSKMEKTGNRLDILRESVET
jgi:hypothetical protein